MSPAAAPDVQPELPPHDPPAQLVPGDGLGVDVVGQAEHPVRLPDVRREPLVVAGGPGETRRPPRQQQAGRQGPRPRHAGLGVQRLDEQREQPGRLAAVVGLPHPRLEAGQFVRIEVGAPRGADGSSASLSCPRYRAPVDTQSAAHGMYGPESEAWALNREAMLLLGAGPRALLLQIAHPAVAAGVDEHSDFRADPWRRLAGTLKSYLTIVYGSGPAARAEIRRLNALHRGIVGAGYSARDPELSLWVHATLVDSTLRRRTSAGSSRSRRERRERAYQETVPIGRAFGVPEALLPPDLEAFEAYVAGCWRPMARSSRGRSRASWPRVVLHPPLAPLTPGRRAAPRRGSPPSPTTGRCGRRSGCCRRRVREAYELPWGVRERAVSAWLVAGWRAWRPLIPRTWRQMPKALAADARVAEPRRRPVPATATRRGERLESNRGNLGEHRRRAGRAASPHRVRRAA